MNSEQVIIDTSSPANTGAAVRSGPYLTSGTTDRRRGADVHADSGAHSHSHAHSDSCDSTSHSHAHGHSSVPLGSSVYEVDASKTKASTTSFFRQLRLLAHDPKTMRVLIYTGVLFLYILLEFVYGLYVDSLALIADSWHTAFGCASLATRLGARLVSTQWASHRAYSYGYARFEIVAGFVVGMSAVFVSLFIVFESLEHFMSTCFGELIHIEGGSGMLTVAVIGLLIKLVGVLFFYDHMRLRAELTTPYMYPGDVWRHIMVDAVCSLGVMINSWVATWRPSGGADALVAFLIAMLIILNAVPVSRSTGRILLQTTPLSLSDQLHKAVREAATCEGVLEVRNEHFWTVAPGKFAGSVVVRARSDASHERVLESVRHVFAPFINHLTVQIDKDVQIEDFHSGRSQSPALGGSGGAHGHGHSHGHAH